MYSKKFQKNVLTLEICTESQAGSLNATGYSSIDQNILTLSKRNNFSRVYENSSEDEVDVDEITEQKSIFGSLDPSKLCKFFFHK